MSYVMTGVDGFPLGVATLVRSADPRLAEREVGDLIEPRRLKACSGSRTPDIRISHMAMGFGHLFGVSHGAALIATSGPLRSYQVMVPLRGKLVAHTRRGEIVATPGSALVYSPRDRMETFWSKDCTSLVLSIPEERLRSLAREVCPGKHDDGITLHPLMPLRSGSGRSFANTLGIICQESVDPESAFSRGLTTGLIERALLLSLLSAQRQVPMFRLTASNSRRTAYLDRALALIDKHCAGDIGMADLLHATGVSARTLQYAFVQQFGVGPITYLKQTRLRRIQQDLLGARDDHHTVGDVAAKWGYYNGSVFARAYHKLFGELPSQTLASRKRPD